MRFESCDVQLFVSCFSGASLYVKRVYIIQNNTLTHLELEEQNFKSKLS